MRILRRYFTPLILLFCFGPLRAEQSAPQFSLGINIAQFAGYAIGSKIVRDLTYLPFHVSTQYRLTDHLSLTGSLVYRFEDYPPGTGPRGEGIENPWHKHHDIWALAGVRHTANTTGITGFFAGAQLGAGYSFSPNYYERTILIQPEIGYAWVFSGFYLEAGGSIIVNIPFDTMRDISPLLGKGAANPFHRLIPVFNLTLGFAL